MFRDRLIKLLINRCRDQFDRFLGDVDSPLPERLRRPDLHLVEQGNVMFGLFPLLLGCLSLLAKTSLFFSLSFGQHLRL